MARAPPRPPPTGREGELVVYQNNGSLVYKNTFTFYALMRHIGTYFLTVVYSAFSYVYIVITVCNSPPYNYL